MANEMDAVGSIDVASDALCEATKSFGTRLCPYVFLSFLINELEVFQGLSGFWVNNFVRKARRRV